MDKNKCPKLISRKKSWENMLKNDLWSNMVSVGKKIILKVLLKKKLFISKRI